MMNLIFHQQYGLPDINPSLVVIPTPPTSNNDRIYMDGTKMTYMDGTQMDYME